MNVAVLGASFDPPHNGHLTLANNVLRSQKTCPDPSQKIQQIILMPVNVHPFGKKLTPAVHRLAMAKLLEGKNIKVSDLEIKRGKISYTIDTLNELKKLYPKDHFIWIIGEDQIKNFKKWKSWQEIIEKFGLIVIPRKGFRHSEKQDQNNEKHTISITINSFKPIDVSSSEIKKRIKEGKSIKNLVPKTIKNYIIRHNLYQKLNIK